jgi:tRNA nucleotidyltransferase (CCA-adding enzyme)
MQQALTMGRSIELLNRPVIKHLRNAFLSEGFDIRFVGGCVRDMMLGAIPHDIDMCTNATPIEQIRVYENHDIRYISTGEAHGTYTVVLYDDDAPVVLEITSLRIDTNTDGRHADVVYTHDWLLDLSRRDFTINAMSLTFDNELVDPFNGAEDLKNGRVVFVGNAEERIHEDYLRILRWFRFSARYSHGVSEANTFKTISKPEVSSGLRKISRERVWSEMSKIVAGPDGDFMVSQIIASGVNEYIDLPYYASGLGCLVLAKLKTNDPITLMAAYCVGKDKDSITKLATAWKWSTDERSKGQLICANLNRDTYWNPTGENGFNLADAKKQVVKGANKDWLVQALLIVDSAQAAELAAWEVPVLPVNGADIVSAGFEPGPQVGKLHRIMRDRWIESNYALSKFELMTALDTAE